MIIRCKFEKICEVYSEKEPDRNYNYLGRNIGFDITKNKLYIVYGINISKFSTPSIKFYTKDGIFFYSDIYYDIIDDSGSFFPVLGGMFDVVCPHLWGNIWCFKHIENDGRFNTLGVLGHEEQVTDLCYANRLLLEGKTEDMKKLAKWIDIVNDHAVNASCNCCPNIQDIVDSAQLSEWYQERINQ